MRNVRFSLKTLLLASALITLPVWLNTRPARVTYWQDSKFGFWLVHAERGWPFTYLYLFRRLSESEIESRDGSTPRVALPQITHPAALVVDAMAGASLVFGMLWLIRCFNRGFRSISSRTRQNLESPVQSTSRFRLRVIPTAGLWITAASIGLPAAGLMAMCVFRWLDISLKYGFAPHNPAFRFAFMESTLGLVASGLWLFAAKSCWRARDAKAALFTAIGFGVALLLLVLLIADRWNGWTEFGLPFWLWPN